MSSWKAKYLNIGGFGRNEIMLINIGYENFVNGRLVAVVLDPDSAHVKKLRQEATEKSMLINATSGHKTRSVIVLTTGQVILSSLQTTTFRVRTNKSQSNQRESEDD